MIKTKNDCVHKFNGKSLLVIIEKINEKKYKVKCQACNEILVLKKKHITNEIKLELD